MDNEFLERIALALEGIEQLLSDKFKHEAAVRSKAQTLRKKSAAKPRPTKETLVQLLGNKVDDTSNEPSPQTLDFKDVDFPSYEQVREVAKLAHQHLGAEAYKRLLFSELGVVSISDIYPQKRQEAIDILSKYQGG